VTYCRPTERRRTSCIKQRGYDALTQISAIKTTQNDFKWHIDNTVLWKLPHSFPKPFLLASVACACKSGQQAINNIYRSVYVTSKACANSKHRSLLIAQALVTSTLNIFLRYNGHRHIGGASTTNRHLAPLPKEPSRISLMYLIFLETRIIHLHFPADSLCLSLFNFFWSAPQLPARLLYF